MAENISNELNVGFELNVGWLFFWTPLGKTLALSEIGTRKSLGWEIGGKCFDWNQLIWKWISRPRPER
jgi:hypothetical protein